MNELPKEGRAVMTEGYEGYRFDVEVKLYSGSKREAKCPNCDTQWDDSNWPEWTESKHVTLMPVPPRCPRCGVSVKFIIVIPNEPERSGKLPRCGRWFDGDPSVNVLPEVETIKDAECCCRLLETELAELTELRPIETAPRDGTPVLLFVRGYDLWVDAVYDSDMSDAQSRRPPATHWLPLPVDRQGVYRSARRTRAVRRGSPSPSLIG